MKLTEAQNRALRRCHDLNGQTHRWTLRASKPTINALMRLGLLEERFPGVVTLTPAGRDSLRSPRQGGE